MFGHLKKSTQYWKLILLLCLTALAACQTTTTVDDQSDPTPESATEVMPTPTEMVPTESPTKMENPEETDLSDPIATLSPELAEKFTSFKDTVMVPGYEVEWFHPVVLEPRWGCAGPNGEALINGRANESAYTIYEIGDDFQLIEYASFPGHVIMSFEFDPDGRLWFTDVEGGLYTTSEDGDPVLIADSFFPQKFIHNIFIKIASNGDIFALEKNVGDRILRITQNGDVEVFAEGFIKMGKLLLIGPKDDLIVHDKGAGQLIQVTPDGEKIILMEGTPGWEDEFEGGFFLPENVLYQRVIRRGVYRFNLNTGESSLAESFLDVLGVFSGIYLIEPSTVIAYDMLGAISVNLETTKINTILLSYGNTYAMSVDPKGQIYAAYGEPTDVDNAKTYVYRIDSPESRTLIGTLPGNKAGALDFGPDGIGYILTESRGGPKYIHKFDPQSNTFTEFLQGPRDVDMGYSLAVDPLSGTLWWGRTSGDGAAAMHYYETDGKTGFIPMPEGCHRAFPTFAPDGTLYVGVEYKTEPGVPVVRKLFRLEKNQNWTEVVDFTADNINAGFEFPTVCSDGIVYVLGYLSANIVDPELPAGSNPIMTLFRVDDGEITPLVRQAGIDGFKIDCDWLTDDIYYMSSDGIHRFFQAGD